MKGPTALRAGEPVKVPLGESEIVVVKSEFRLYFLHNGGYVRDFPVGLGREGSTPETTFVIREKIRNPDWNPKPGVTIPYGSPENILGTRWMAFNNSAEYRGFGIHGTTQPDSIGKEASSGCVRMLRPDVELLFDWCARGTRVRVVR
jgi:lipoprotein-anchoring transpeptidase ErfK/SrfK